MRRGRRADAVKVDFQRALGGVQNHSAILAFLEVPTQRHDAMGRKVTFEVVANRADRGLAGHRVPPVRSTGIQMAGGVQAGCHPQGFRVASYVAMYKALSTG